MKLSGFQSLQILVLVHNYIFGFPINDEYLSANTFVRCVTKISPIVASMVEDTEIFSLFPSEVFALLRAPIAMKLSRLLAHSAVYM